MNRVTHPFPPVYDSHSRILILGTFPSVQSRRQLFYYGHPQNRFWKVLAALFGEEVPRSVHEKKALLLRNGLALWDCIESCVISGSSDASIREVRPNDLSVILSSAPIGRIVCNGRKSYELYGRYLLPRVGMQAECLPSTSPANARWTLEKLIADWSVLLPDDQCSRVVPPKA